MLAPQGGNVAAIFQQVGGAGEGGGPRGEIVNSRRKAQPADPVQHETEIGLYQRGGQARPHPADGVFPHRQRAKAGQIMGVAGADVIDKCHEWRFNPLRAKRQDGAAMRTLARARRRG